MATINATTSQGGYLDNQRTASLWNWSDVVDASAGNATLTDVDGTYIYSRAMYQGGRSAFWLCSRGYLVFDTSAITGTLTSLSLMIYVESVFDLNYFPDAIVQLTSSPTLTTALLATDWQYINGNVASSSFSSAGSTWETITLNGNAISVAETESEMTLQIRDAYYDYYISASPSADGYMEYRYNYSGFIPYLDYTMVTGYGQTVNGVIAANMSTVDGTAKASISKVLGV
jgi:hypothetical protein